MDMFISYFAMPIGVTICFGPAILLWLCQEYGSLKENQPGDPKK